MDVNNAAPSGVAYISAGCVIALLCLAGFWAFRSKGPINGLSVDGSPFSPLTRILRLLSKLRMIFILLFAVGFGGSIGVILFFSTTPQSGP